MKTSAIVCAVLAGTMGFASLASAMPIVGEIQGYNVTQDPGDHNYERGDRIYQRNDRNDRHWQRGDRTYQQRYYNDNVYGQRPYTPNPYAYAQPNYGPRYYRGGYLPREYYGNRSYYVSNWNAYPGLYAPPYGYQWMNVDGQFLLVALATGLIANALVSGY